MVRQWDCTMTHRVLLSGYWNWKATVGRTINNRYSSIRSYEYTRRRHLIAKSGWPLILFLKQCQPIIFLINNSSENELLVQYSTFFRPCYFRCVICNVLVSLYMKKMLSSPKDWWTSSLRFCLRFLVVLIARLQSIATRSPMSQEAERTCSQYRSCIRLLWLASVPQTVLRVGQVRCKSVITWYPLGLLVCR